jgi:hypothetical protein
MNRLAGIISIVVLTAWFVLAGCTEQGVGPVPISVQEYKTMGRADRNRWPRERVLQINLTRVHDPELPLKERMDSMALVEHIGTNNRTDLEDLATLLRNPRTPKELNKAVLLFLLKQNYSDLAAFTTQIIQDPNADPELKQAVLDWLKAPEHSAPQMLAGVVRSWARDPEGTEQSEEGYRQAVRQISKQPWDATLLEALNTPEFAARGEALELLASRLPRAQLRQKIMAIHPKSDSVKAIQGFLERFDYIPSTREELISTTILFKVRRDMIPDAAKLSLDWQRNYGYTFHIRDFHLLSRLARDPLRSNLKRTQLQLEIGKALKTRPHVQTADTHGVTKDNFWLQVDKLTMVDLWNLYLINEMLSRPRVQISLTLMADGDLADKNSAWGGLVFYQNGQAEAILYPPDPSQTNDLIYQPSSRMITDSRDSLCRFIGHFSKIDNADRAGPSSQELDDARTNRYYGLTLTRIDKNTFTTHYFNPDGLVISLGKFPLRQ